MNSEPCPECDAPVELKAKPERSERVRCLSCGTELIVVQVSPLRIDWAFQPPLERDRSDSEDPKEPN